MLSSPLHPLKHPSRRTTYPTLQHRLLSQETYHSFLSASRPYFPLLGVAQSPIYSLELSQAFLPNFTPLSALD